MVYASDTFGSSPGNHSKHARERFVTASPTFAAEAFIDDVERIVEAHRTDLVMPAFEEVFVLAKHRARIERYAPLFAPSFDLLHTLHDKQRFTTFARKLGLRVPETLVARSDAELREAITHFPRYFARAAYSRGGVTLLTNAGSLAGAVELSECHPTSTNPFLVQPFLEGTDLCTFSIAHHGRVTAHVTYVHPLTIESAGGITFESIVEPRTLEITRRVVEETGYHGQISFDFLRDDDGLHVVECNPRPTAGLMVMPDAIFDAGLRDDTNGQTLVAPAGTRRKLSLAILRNMVVQWKEIPEDLEALVRAGKDVYADPKDIVPLLYQLIAYSHVIGYRRKTGEVKRTDLMQGYFYDICWDGGAL